MPDGNNLNGRVLSTLIDFDLIVNTDIGLIKFIRNNYRDDRVFNLRIIDRSDRDILSLLYSRKNYNPLSTIMNPEFINEADSLYKSFFDTYKQEILDNSFIFDKIYNFVMMAINSGMNLGISTTIAINDSLEDKELEKHFGNVSIIDKSDKSTIISREAFYINDYKFFDRYGKSKILHKKIYITPMQYNIDYLEKDESKFVTQNQFILFGEDFKGDNNNAGT